MKRRGRIRRVAKWAGAVVCVLIAAGWVVSIWWELSCVWSAPGPHNPFNPFVRCVGVGTGHVRVAFDLADEDWSGPFWTFGPSDAPMSWWLDYRWYFEGTVSLEVPLWMPFVLVGVPTAWLFWRDRRVRPGHCVCGYDLAGLAAGTPCPECGKINRAD